MVIGYNTGEIKRINKAIAYQEKVKEYNLFFPALEPDWEPISYSDFVMFYNFPKQWVYEKGGRSNNCGGGCFKMSRQSWYHLYKNDIEEFNKWILYEQEIHNNICDFRDKKYGIKWRETFATKENHLWLDRKKSLLEYRKDWDKGIIPRMRKRTEQPPCKVGLDGKYECGFTL